jgi:hypothetical protein
LRQGIEKPLDGVEAVTGAAGAGSIVVVDVGIFAGIVGIVTSVTGVAMTPMRPVGKRSAATFSAGSMPTMMVSG